MKCLSIRQPHAYHILTGQKPIEFRSWTTNYRGPLLIVASKNSDDPSATDQEGKPLPGGVMVCVVELYQITGQDKNYSWHLRNPRPVEPKSFLGKLGLIEVDNSLIQYLPPKPVQPNTPKETPMPTPVIEWKPDLSLKVTAKTDEFKPYPHQNVAWAALDKHFITDKKNSGILVVPTGGGKTTIASRWVLEKYLRAGARVLWFAHRHTLLRQAFNDFIKFSHRAAPKEQLRMICISSLDKKWSEVDRSHDVIFSSIQSASGARQLDHLRLIHKQSPNGLIVVVDEAHHSSARSYQRTLRLLKDELGCPILGLTATPVRMMERDEKNLWALFKEIIYQVKKEELVSKGILATPIPESVRTEISFEKDFTTEDLTYLKRFGELAPNVLQRIAAHSSRNKLIVEHYLKQKDTYGKTLIFAVDTLHAQTLAKEFQNYKVKADYVDYSRKDSQEVMQRYRTQADPQILVNVEMMTEGFDAPWTKTVFLTRPTRSEALFSQMIGRALRGPAAGGNKEAHLVSFVDTWALFNPLGTNYPAKGGEHVPIPETNTAAQPIVWISDDLIFATYQLVMERVKTTLEGTFQCFPYAWYVWEEELEDDIRRRMLLVFEHQRQGFATLEKDFLKNPTRLPANISEEWVRDLVQRCFKDSPSPLPAWEDVQALLVACQQGVDWGYYTFQEKERFDPAKIARDFLERDLGPKAQATELQKIFQREEACRLLYKQHFNAFQEDVSHAMLALSKEASVEAPRPEVVKAAPKSAPRPWPEGNAGYQPELLVKDVSAQKANFPKSAPKISQVAFSQSPLSSLWGFYRHEDQTIVLNCVLNSPDIPRFVVEFVLFHEMLHAELPYSGHDKSFREREGYFMPSSQALAETTHRKLDPPKNAQRGWCVLADQFLDTFAEYYSYKAPGSVMGL